MQGCEEDSARLQQLDLPPTRKKPAYFGAGKAVINQVNHAAVGLAAYHPAGRLYYFLQARIKIGVVVAEAKASLHAPLDLLVDCINLWQAQGCYKCADQAFTWQVYAFGEGTAENGEADAA